MSRWNVAAYVRLSSDDGDKSESNSITNQKSLISLYLKNNSDLKLKDFYIDDGFTGTNFDRPAFQRMLRDIETGKVNITIKLYQKKNNHQRWLANEIYFILF